MTACPAPTLYGNVMYDASVIIPTYRRDGLLARGLESIERQQCANIEVLVVDDGPAELATIAICQRLHARYLWLGRYGAACKWRVPSMALNRGVDAANSDIVVLTSPEIYHVDDCLGLMIARALADRQAMVICDGKDDRHNVFDGSNYDTLPDLNTQMPFLMALRKKHYQAIGGYDEDYIGHDSDDRDFCERMLVYGLHYTNVPVRCVHLYHERYNAEHIRNGSNKKAWKRKRRGSIYRNGVQAQMATAQ